MCVCLLLSYFVFKFTAFQATRDIDAENDRKRKERDEEQAEAKRQCLSHGGGDAHGASTGSPDLGLDIYGDEWKPMMSQIE